MDSDFTSWLIRLLFAIGGFLVGVLTRALGKYIADKSTDKRRKKEAESQARETFASIASTMPTLIQEMKDDLHEEGNEHVRDLVVLVANNTYMGNTDKRRFAFCEIDHDNLRGKLDVLEGNGYLIDVTPSNTPIYKMTEEFVALVKQFG